MITNLFAVLAMTTIAVCLALILVGLSMPRKTKHPTRSQRVRVKTEDETDWWDEPVGDTGWTNGDFICAAELFDD